MAFLLAGPRKASQRVRQGCSARLLCHKVVQWQVRHRQALGVGMEKRREGTRCTPGSRQEPMTHERQAWRRAWALSRGR